MRRAVIGLTWLDAFAAHIIAARRGQKNQTYEKRRTVLLEKLS